MEHSAQAQVTDDKKEWKLEPETEYRFELDSDSTSLAVKLISGLAEVFGAELAVGKTYIFGSECKAAIFTWQGCVLEMRRPSTEYISEETPMSSYANLHLAFEQMRIKTRRAQRGSPSSTGLSESEKQPPRILVIGPENSGKTTACKIIANYAVRAGQRWSPILVNLDSGEGGWTAPGTISACPVNMPIPTSTPANPLGSSATSAPTALTSSALLPLVYWFGHVETRRNPKLMEKLIHTLARRISARLENDVAGSISGLIVDTPSSFTTQASKTGEKYAFIKLCVELFQINVIVVIGHEKLNVEMRREFGNVLSVVKIPKSGGVVDLEFAYRSRVHSLQLHSYLYGQSLPLPAGVSAGALGGEAMEELSLSPHSLVIDFNDLTIYRIGEAVMAPTSALPIGASRVVSEMQPVIIDPAQSGSGLLNAVLALLVQPDGGEIEKDDEAILNSDVAGFLVVTAIDTNSRQMTVLSPGPGSLHGRIALVGSLEWQEQ
ncbi:Pre-mRNA cleavage complex II protein Clp1-domain-containing protein [Hysterangium stoloniferum]|nr:Pre-mRNA cleavage complex II protein Clp1-domain-containing protein [Hysterangium stoloniferum]